MSRTDVKSLVLFYSVFSVWFAYNALSITLVIDDIVNYRSVPNNLLYSSGVKIQTQLKQPIDSDSFSEWSLKRIGIKRSRPSCLDSLERTCRYDTIGKYLEESAKFSIIHRPTDAIPASRRIPQNQGHNTTYISERRSIGPKDGSLTPLVEYNPTFLPLTDDLDPVLLKYLTGRYHKDIPDEEADRVKYLSVSRGTNFHNCGAGMRRLNNPTIEHSYLTLVLYDAYLQPIPGASASVRLAQAFLPTKCMKKYDLEPFQDYQIIAVRSTEGNDKKDQLFVMTSDTKTFIFPIDIRRVPGPTNDASDWNTKVKGKPIPMIVNDNNDVKRHQFYGRGLQIRLMEEKNAPGRRNFCKNFLDSNIMDFQKNYHIFETTNNEGAMKTYMEIRPHGRRKTREVNFYAEHFHKIGDWELVPDGTINDKGHRDTSDIVTNIKRNNHIEDQWKHPFPDSTYWKDGGSRGTACCIDLTWGTNDAEVFKVGISHSVSAERGYVSRFYAFETKSSRFKNIAVSGPFCLGRLAPGDINGETQIFPSPDGKNLTIGNESYDCPKITFASGLVEYQADPNYVVLSYGVDDCYSRSIVISKERIREFLNLNAETHSANVPK